MSESRCWAIHFLAASILGLGCFCTLAHRWGLELGKLQHRMCMFYSAFLLANGALRQEHGENAGFGDKGPLRSQPGYLPGCEFE